MVKREEHVASYRLLGLLMGLTVVNQTQFDLSLPTMFFQLLMDKNFDPTIEDMTGFDDTLKQQLVNAKDWDTAKYKEIVEMEGGDWDLHNDDDHEEAYQHYVKYVLHSTLIEGTQWQMDSLRWGFFRILSKTQLDNVQLTPTDCKEIVCGISDPITANFDFREVFQIVTDSDLVNNKEFHDIFWEVIQGFTVKQKRDLLLFITGISKLPAKGRYVQEAWMTGEERSDEPFEHPQGPPGILRTPRRGHHTL